MTGAVAGMPTGESDRVLVLAARAGDKEAFAVLLARHQPMLLALCQRASGDPDLGEDAAQEAALTAFLNLDRLRKADRFGPWLGGIGLNICRRLLRERSRDAWSWDVVHGGRQTHDLADSKPGPEALAEVADLAERTRAAIAILPPGQRAAVVLFYLSDLTHAETADLLGVNVGAVKTRLHKARRSLKHQLSDARKDDGMDERITRRALTTTAAALTGTAALGHETTAQAKMTKGGQLTDAQGAPELVPMRVADVRRKRAANGQARNHMVVLEEASGASAPRRLAIWVGESEGMAIAMHLESVQMPRPLTAAFAADLLRAAGGRLLEVRIDRLVETVFYATAVVDGVDAITTIDARPSDAINLALVTGAAIRIDARILEAAGLADDALKDTTEGPSDIVAEVLADWPGHTVDDPEVR
jgi:RNA polymerase sigma-70 factor (ECF subfamily)